MTLMMMKITVTKIPVLSEKSALSIFGRVLSGERQVRIGEIVYADRISASLDEHIAHRTEPRCAPSLFTESVHRVCSPSGANMYTERSRYVHRAEPRCQYFCFSTNAFINAIISAISCFVRFNFS
jgi:hypothetical protein